MAETENQPQPQQPDVGAGLPILQPKVNMTGEIIHHDYIKNMLQRTSNKGYYRSYINPFCPKSSQSCFGNFPKSYMKKAPKDNDFNIDIYEKSQAATASNLFVTKNLGTGGKATTLQERKPIRDIPIPMANAYKKRAIPTTNFRRVYDVGDIPVSVNQTGQGGKLFWKIKPPQINYNHFLPLFFEGLREKQDPYRFIAVQGVFDLLEEGGAKIFHVIPQLIIPIKTALNTRDPEIIAVTLKVLQKLVQSGDMVGEMLVPYYRQILPIFNIFKNSNLNIGDKIDYYQRKKLTLGDLIQETLELFEQTGGEDAFINIKYMIPTYESCMIN